MSAPRDAPARIAPPDWLAAGPAGDLLALLDTGGEEARVVGGAVRNSLIGLPPGDIDIATTWHPEAVMRRVEAAGFKAVPTGIEHGTVTVVAGGAGYEVTTLREDVATDGRRAVVRFGRDWRADAGRRDFTVNAMSLTRAGDLYDYFGGRADLQARRIRFIGDAVRRIREDRLRVLRFFRFHAAYGLGEPDREGLSACIREREGLDLLSRERLRTEILKLLAAPGAAPTCQVMADCGILGQVLGGIANAAQLGRLTAVEAALGLAPDATLRLGAAAVLIREDAERLRARLALSNEEYRRLDGIGHGWAGPDPARGELAAKAILFAAGPRGYRDRALIAFARSGAPVTDAGWTALATLPERWKAPSFPVSGTVLAARGLAGPALGAMLGDIRARWMAAGFPLGRAEVERLVDEAFAAARPH